MQKKHKTKLALIEASVFLLYRTITGIDMAMSASQTQAAEFTEVTVQIIRSVEDAKALEGTEIGISDWIVIDQKRIDEFAKATDDYQWIHVDTERAAKELPNGKTIAHGYLTLSLIPALTSQFVQVENVAQTINFGCNKIRFYTMVPVGSRVRARATVKQARKRAGALHLLSEVRIEVEGERKPACIAETLGMYFFNESATTD